MKNLLRVVLLVAVYLCSVGVSGVCAATEFPIATTSGPEIGISAATDGTNYLVGIQGDASGNDNITAQLVSASTGSLVGSRISVGRTGGAPQVASSGTNYLMVWEDDATDLYHLYGQLVSTSGTLSGPAFIINNDASGQQKQGSLNSVMYDGINYFVVWEYRSDPSSSDTADLYGQFITPAGALLGSPIAVSTAPHGQRDPALAFDGNRILVVWADGRDQSAGSYESDTYGQFVTKSSSDTPGALSGTNFLISSSDFPRDQMGPSVAFDGARYLVIFLQETTLPNACPVSGCKWDIYGQFVTTAGVADGSTITVSNTSPNHIGMWAHWNANLNRYLVTWIENFGTISHTIKARYFTASGSTLGDEFIFLSKTADNLIPIFAVARPTATGYFTIVNRGITGTWWDNMGKDVYGAFISPVLYSSFTNAGIWKWEGSSWSQITPSTPEMMVVSGLMLYGDFGSSGIWKYDGSTWSQVTFSNPEAMAISGSTLYGSFAGGGIWKYDGSAWTQLTPNNPQMMALSGTTLYGAFSGAGIWKWDDSTWKQATPNNPQMIAVSGTTLYGAFAGGGIWKYNGTNWTQVTPNTPQLLVASGDNLYGSFAGAGIWKWNGTTWTQITPNTPQLIVASGDNLYGSFAGGGIWQWNGTTWTQVTPNNPASMVLGY